MPLGLTRLFCALIFVTAVPFAEAASWTWTGGGGNANWGTGTNWLSGTVPASNSATDLFFAGTNNTGTALVPLNQNIATPFQLNNLRFNLASGSFFLGGGSLAFTGATNIITQDSASAQSIANNIVASNNSTVVLTLAGNGAGVVTLGGGINKSNGNRNYAITKTGNSTFSLTGASDYDGLTTINAGVLNIRNATALGSSASGTTVATGAALQIQGGIVVGPESLTLNGSGIAADGAFRNISGNNSFAGTITLGSASTIASDSGTLTLGGNVNNGGFLLTETGAGNVTMTGVISGTGGLLKTGSGTLTLSGAASNTYTGATTVSAGTLILAKPVQLVDPAITIGGAGTSATVQLNAPFQLFGAATTINSGGQLNLNNNDEYIGTLTMSGGTIVTGTGSLYLGPGITSNASNVSSTMSGNYLLTGNHTFTVASGTTPSGQDLIVSGPVSEFNAGTTITKTGSGTLVLSGANSYTGLTTISSGALNVQNASGLGTTAAGTNVTSGAALQLQGGIAIGNEALTLNGGGVAATGALRNISGNNSFAGPISLASASTISSDSGTLTLTGGIVNGGFTTTLGGASTIVESGIVSGLGGLNKTGAGTASLTGTNSFTGATTVSGGTLTVAGSSGSALGSTSGITVNSGGTLMLGANNQINNAATMTLAGGTFAKGNFSEGTAGTLGLGALTLTSAGSQIDFGNGSAGVLTFAGFAPGAFSLTVTNWTGTPGSAGSGSTDRLIFNSDQSGNLGSFNFDGYAGAMAFNLGNGFYEITPVVAVPEPSTYVTAALALAAIGFHQVRRRRRPSKWG